MSGPNSQDEGVDPGRMDDILMFRRLRNVTALQVRNLTPFPVRDSFATAMTQPSEQSQFTSMGRLSDDLDVTLGKRRGRRISSSSTMTTKTVRSEESEDIHNTVASEDGQRRRGAFSKVSFIGQAAVESSPHTGRRPPQVYGSPSAIRPHRPRTMSTGSYRSLGTNSTGISENDQTPVIPSQLSRLFPDNSQNSLEKIVASRLVETFITITVPPSFSVITPEKAPSSPLPVKLADTPPGSRPTSPVSSIDTNDMTTGSRHESTLSSSSSSSLSEVYLGQPSSSREHSTSAYCPTSPSLSRSPVAKSAQAWSKSVVTGSRMLKKSSLSSATSSHTFRSDTTSIFSRAVPDYISPVHTPSTNPYFSLDPSSVNEFPEWTDLNAQEMRVELWGKVRGGWRNEKTVNGKGKEKAVNEDTIDPESPMWQVLESWDVNLSDLRPWTGELASQPSHLSFNTLSITLGPYGHTYHVPSLSLARNSRPSSPTTAGRISDVDRAAITTLGNAGDIIVPASTSELESTRARAVDLMVQQDKSQSQRLKRHPESTKTASWQDLVRLVTLQACILDTKRSLSQVVCEVDRLVTDRPSDLKREVSERQAWVNQLQSERDEVHRTSEDLKFRIRTRLEDLRQRRETLHQAREELQLDMFAEHEIEEELEDSQEQLSSLRRNFAPVRTTLVATLANIFPIELLSTTPDLLYTILDVPLPIPAGATDPAPPLFVSSRKDVNEDTVATALGYAAQVVQLLAAYVGKRLVYPVTCIGSRSLVRDGISTMVGPRMFPLYSKGVDTYRFEYGVYLLNKDIEMLMTERDLRATDTRYTLPNLNNLLLTISAGDAAQLPPCPPADSLPSSRVSSPIPSDNASTSTPIEDVLSTSNTTPPISGTTTPTASADSSTFSRMSRPFFSLSPFGLLRSTSSDRPPSKPSRSNGVEPPAEESNWDARNPDQGGDEEEDRRTIRAVSLHGDETKQYLNGSTENGAVPQAEKATDSGRPEVTTPTNIATSIV